MIERFRFLQKKIKKMEQYKFFFNGPWAFPQFASNLTVYFNEINSNPLKYSFELQTRNRPVEKKR